MSRSKQASLLWLAVAGLLVLLLAMGLPGVQLHPGRPFSLGRPQVDLGGGTSLLSDNQSLLVIFQGIIALALILLPVYIIFSLLTPEGRRRLVADVIAFGVLFAIAEYLHSLPYNPDATQQTPAAEIANGLSQLDNSGPTAVFSATPPNWLVVLVSLAVSVAAVLGVSGLIRFIQHRRRAPRTALSKLADEAQTAMAALQHGGDLELTIIRCYQEMVRVIRDEQALTREQAMTPREFEDRLVARGLPRPPVLTLTRLFEQARYGRLPADSQQEAQAVACLTEIADACRSLHGPQAPESPRAS
jgi:hypothetical protein